MFYYVDKETSKPKSIIIRISSLLKRTIVPEETLQLKHYQDLLIEIDWKNNFDFITKKQLILEDQTNREKELKVKSAIEGLFMLDKLENGKVVSVGLKLKYWAGISYQELFGYISPLKTKSEIRQRFYFFDGQLGISNDEAYRFYKIGGWKNRYRRNAGKVMIQIERVVVVVNMDYQAIAAY